MYLKTAFRKTSGRTHLSIAQNYRDEAGKTRTLTIESLGYADEYTDKYEDPIAHFKEVVAKMERERKESLKPIVFEKSPKKKIDKRTQNRKNLGFAALSQIYHELGLGLLILNRSRTRNFDFSPNAALKLLVYERILNPGSKSAAQANKDWYFEDFDLSLDDVYFALDFFNTLKEDIVSHLHRRCCDLYGRKTEVCYYDVTNYYFEIDLEDDFRKKGFSKEMRKDPIVQMGLLMDTMSLPITYKLHPGNTPDSITLIPTLAEVKGSLGIERVVIVADKALNTGDNIAACLAKGDGYVFSQSVRGATEEMKQWVLDEKGYLDTGGGSRIKSRIAIRKVKVTLEEADKKSGKKKKTKTIEITERQVVRYSEKYARRARAGREKAIAKAKGFVANPQRMDAALERTVAKYIKGLTIDVETGEILKASRILTFDEDRLKEEELFDGYYVICTSEVEKRDEEILGIYRGLWRIEESFRITKSDLTSRPVYLSLEERINAHFLTCFIALLILRILEMKTGHKYTPSELIDTLKKASGTHVDRNWYIFDHRDDVLEAVGAAVGIDFSREMLCKKDIRSIIGATKKK